MMYVSNIELRGVVFIDFPREFARNGGLTFFDN